MCAFESFACCTLTAGFCVPPLFTLDICQGCYVATSVCTSRSLSSNNFKFSLFSFFHELRSLPEVGHGQDSVHTRMVEGTPNAPLRTAGSVPVEKIQNILRCQHRDLYDKVVGSKHRSWNKFVEKHQAPASPGRVPTLIPAPGAPCNTSDGFLKVFTLSAFAQLYTFLIFQTRFFWNQLTWAARMDPEPGLCFFFLQQAGRGLLEVPFLHVLYCFLILCEQPFRDKSLNSLNSLNHGIPQPSSSPSQARWCRVIEGIPLFLWL